MAEGTTLEGTHIGGLQSRISRQWVWVGPYGSFRHVWTDDEVNSDSGAAFTIFLIVKAMHILFY